MEAEKMLEKLGNKYKNEVHRILAHSYFVYFLSFLFGMIFDLLSPFKIFSHSSFVLLGVALLLFGTFLVIWAQESSRNFKKENLSKDIFFNGPYYYTRSPTHWGLFFLMLGFGIIANAVFIVLSTLVAFLITRFFFLDKEEEILEKKYGIHYLEYKKIVKF